MNATIILGIFQFAALLFAISFHEAAHAWMASRLGDPTARMLGRVTLNPAKHIDPVGTILFPIIGILTTGFPFGWAKPTPVTTRNFSHIVRDDILTTLAGPFSNLLGAIASLLVLLVMKHAGPDAANAVGLAMEAALTHQLDPASMTGLLFPVALVFYYGIFINLILLLFNLIPIPPLDGSHVVRHFLPYKALRVYDAVGMYGIFLIFFLGGRLIYPFLSAALAIFNGALAAL
jgi:Zn-dependent protease